MEKNNAEEISEPALLRFLFSSTKLSWLWFLIRIYIGWQWLVAGWNKVISSAWVGDKAGTAVHSFLTGSLTKTTGAHPDVQGWYAYFVKNIALPNDQLFSYLVSFGELFVGIALILGALTGIAAFFGVFMNINYLFAGTISTNPLLLILGIVIMLAWRTAGRYGLDKFILLSVNPGKSRKTFKKHN